MHSRFAQYIIRTAVTALLCCSAQSSRSADPPPTPFRAASIVGNWEIEFIDAEGGRVVGEMSFLDAANVSDSNAGEWLSFPGGSDKFAFQNRSLTGNRLYAYLYSPLFPQRHMNVAFTASGQSANGTLHWGDNIFATVTMRKMVPTLTGRVLAAGPLRPGALVKVALEGSGLPRHLHSVKQYYSVSIDDPAMRYEGIRMPDGQWQLTFRVMRPVERGRKVITINGSTVPIDLLTDPNDGRLMATGPSAVSPVPPTASVTDPATGETTHTTRNYDGSRLVVVEDRDGLVLRMETHPPLGSGISSVSTQDTLAGITRTVIRDSRGRQQLIESLATVNPLGDASVTQVDHLGNVTEVIDLDDGPMIQQDSDIYDRSRLTVTLEDGTVLTSADLPDGSRFERVDMPDGSGEILLYGADGRLIAKTTRGADGGATTSDSSGGTTSIRSTEDGSGLRIEAVDSDGNRTRQVIASDGATSTPERERAIPYEPGEDYYLNELGGTEPWATLDDGLKRRFAQREHERHAKRDADALRADQAEARQADKAARDARFAKLEADLNERLAAIQAEQDSADRATAARLTQEDLELRRDDVRERLNALDRQVRIARDMGDLEMQQRLEKAHDRLHQDSLTLFEPTETESAEIERKQQVRNTLLDEVGVSARRFADMAYRETDVGQGLSEDLTAGGRYLSFGAEAQQQLKENTRIAMRERAGAKGWFQAIEARMKDPATTPEEKAILADMTDMARVRMEGADRLQADIDRIETAAYAFDAATLLSGTIAKAGAQTLTFGRQVVAEAISHRAANRAFVSSLAQGATRAEATQAAKVAGQQAIARAKGLATGLKDSAVSLATSAGKVVVPEAVAAEAVGAANNIKGFLAAERELPGVIQKAMGRFAEDKVAEAVVVDATVGALADAGIQLYQTGTIDVAEVARSSLVGGMFAGARAAISKPFRRANTPHKPSDGTPEARPGATTIDDPAAGEIFDSSDGLLPGPIEPPIGARSEHLSATEIGRLQEPGRNLTPEEVVAKADLFRDLVQRRKAVIDAEKQGKPRAELIARTRDFFEQLDRIRGEDGGVASATPIHAPSTPATALRPPENAVPNWQEAHTRVDGPRRTAGSETERFGGAPPPSIPRPARPGGAPRGTQMLPQSPTHASPGEATTVLDGQGRPSARPDGTLTTTEHQEATVKLDRSPLEAGPDEATLLLDARGRPLVGRAKPHETQRLPSPGDIASPGDATTILDANGRPVMRADGQVTTTRDQRPHDTVKLRVDQERGHAGDATVIFDERGRPRLRPDGSLVTTETPATKADSPLIAVEEVNDLATLESARDEGIPVVEELLPDEPSSQPLRTTDRAGAATWNEQAYDEFRQAFLRDRKIRNQERLEQAEAHAAWADMALRFKPPPSGQLRRSGVRHLVQGDGAYLREVMDEFSATQGFVYVDTVNAYAQQMIDDKFKWHEIPVEGRIVLVTDNHVVAHGHHRFIAAKLAASATGRPLMDAPNAIIPAEGFAPRQAIGALDRYAPDSMQLREGFKPVDGTALPGHGTGSPEHLR